MQTQAVSRGRDLSTFVLVGVLVLGGCAAAAPSSLPSDGPSPSSELPTPTSSQSPSVAPTPIPASPTPAPSDGGATGSWTRLDDMTSPRSSFTALELLDGRVFVIDHEPCNGMSELTGPPRPPGRTDILDPTTGRWTAAEALNATRLRFVAIRLRDGRVLVTGGDNGWWGAYSSTKLFDPATGRWTATGLLNTARKNPIGALLPDGRVLVAGGTFSEGFRDEQDYLSGRVPAERDLRSAEIYDPKTGRWTMTGSLKNAITYGTAYPLPDGRVLALSAAWAPEPVAEIYDPARGTWAATNAPVHPQGSASVVLSDGSLLVVGGTVEVITPGDEMSYVPVATVRRLDPDTGKSVEVSPLPAPRTDAVAVRLADGRVLVAGGTEHGRLPTYLDSPPASNAFLYDAADDTWTETTPMPFADRPGQAVLLADGSVLVTGGSIPLPVAETDGCGPNAVGWTARFIPDSKGR